MSKLFPQQKAPTQATRVTRGGQQAERSPMEIVSRRPDQPKPIAGNDVKNLKNSGA